MCTVNDNHMMYGSWDMGCVGQNFLSFSTIVCPFTALNNPKNRNFEKMTKTPRDIIILHKCTKNHGHIYSISEIRRVMDFHFGLFFATPLTTQKIKILKNWKKHLEISSFYIFVPKVMITWCSVPETWWGRTDIASGLQKQ